MSRPKKPHAEQLRDPITLSKMVRRICDLKREIAACEEWVCPMRRARNIEESLAMLRDERLVDEFLADVMQDSRPRRKA